MKKQLAILTLIAVLMLTISGCGNSEAGVVDETPVIKAQNVKTITVEKGDINRNVSFNGALSAINTVSLTSKVPGEILEVNVKVGDSVGKDQLIYTLDKKDVRRASENAKLAYDAASMQLSSVTDQHELAVKNFERIKALYNSESGSAISTADFEQAEKAASSAGVEAAKAQVAQTKIGMDQAADQYSDADLKSSIAGIVTMVNVEAGQTIGAGQRIADVVNMDQVYVDIQVSENIVNDMESGMTLNAQVPAVSSENIVATIEWVSPAADANTRLFPVRVLFENEDHKLKPGMFAKIDVMVSEADQTIIVPSDTVLQRPDRQIVFVNVDGIAQEKIVVTGFDNGNSVVILEGLSEGDSLITEGQQFLESGTPLNINGGE